MTRIYWIINSHESDGFMTFACYAVLLYRDPTSVGSFFFSFEMQGIIFSLCAGENHHELLCLIVMFCMVEI